MIATFCVPTTGAATVDPPTLSTVASELAGSVSIVVRLPGHWLHIQESYHLQNLRIPCVFERFPGSPPILCGPCDNLGVISTLSDLTSHRLFWMRTPNLGEDAQLKCPDDDSNCRRSGLRTHGIGHYAGVRISGLPNRGSRGRRSPARAGADAYPPVSRRQCGKGKAD